MQKNRIRLSIGKDSKTNFFLRVNLIILFMLLTLMPVLAKDHYQAPEPIFDPDPDATELQRGTVTGTVTDQKGLPIIGATVLVKGTSIGANTDASGKYSLTRVPLNSTLEFSFIGMTTQDITYKGQSSIDVVMTMSTLALDEIVVIG